MEKGRGGGWSEMLYVYVITGLEDRKCILLRSFQLVPARPSGKYRFDTKESAGE